MGDVPNPASRWRRELAGEVAAVYARNPAVSAVVLSGSTARGHADQYSDIELLALWTRPPTQEERADAAAATGHDLVRLYPSDPQLELWTDALKLGRTGNEPHSGVEAEIGHQTIDQAEEIRRKVLVDHDPDPELQNALAGIAHSVTLYDTDARLDTWRREIAAYPTGLATAVVRRFAQVDHFWRWRMWLDRGHNLPKLYEAFVDTTERMLHTLLGLNHVYYSGFKWLERVVDELSVRPDRLVERLQATFEREPAEGAEELRSVVEDVYDLVEEQLPEIDVSWLRTVFRYERPLWGDTPPA
ncbi:MAG: hypothetical protein R3320_06215 [Nitriliruptorales bacterium]|nr:hypothetical protein [Nitriliruptorales bacterium]